MINTLPSGIASLVALLEMAGVSIIGNMIPEDLWLKLRQFNMEKYFLYYWTLLTMAPLYMIMG